MSGRQIVACAFAGFFVLLALAVLAGAQTGGLRVDFPSGSRSELLSPGVLVSGPLELRAGLVSPRRWRCSATNLGRPEYAAASLRPGDRILVDAIYAGVPAGWTVEWARERDFRFLFGWQGMDVYRVVDAGTYHQSVWNIPASAQSHVLVGGEALWIDAVAPGGEPPPDPALLPKAAALFGWDARYDPATWPDLERLRSLYALSPASADRTSRRRDLGWWVTWAAERFAGNANGTTRIPSSRNAWDWGAILWPDGDCLGHYDSIAHCVERYLATGDVGAWQLAALLARHKAAAGFVQTAAVEPGVSSHWRYEKGKQSGEDPPHGIPLGGTRGKPGDDTPPRLSHQWDGGVLLVAALSRDTGLLEVVRRRGEALLQDQAYVRSYGPRGWAWELWNLRAYWLVTGDGRFLARAEAEVRRGLGELAGPLAQWGYWPDDPITGEWSPWQNAMALWMVAAWEAEGATHAFHAAAEACARKVIDRGTRFVPGPGGPYLQGAMLLDRAPWQGQPLPDQWQPPVLTSNYLPLLAIAAHWDPGYLPKWEAAVRTVAQPFRSDWAQLGLPLLAGEDQFDATANGFGGEKINADWLIGARPCFLVR